MVSSERFLFQQVLQRIVSIAYNDNQHIQKDTQPGLLSALRFKSWSGYGAYDC